MADRLCRHRRAAGLLPIPVLMTIWDPPFGVPMLLVSCALLYAEVRREQTATLRVERWYGGRCTACGYEIRATPGRCPECGATGTGR